MLRKVQVQTADFDVGAELAALRATLGANTGAMSLFVGLVREQFQPQGATQAEQTQAIQALHLEHYPGMTERSIQAILDQVAARWALDAALIIHRVGTLAPAEQIVLVIAAAPHRVAALEAVSFMIDYLKTDAVFWKREQWDQGARWLAAAADDHARVQRWRQD